MNNLAFLINSCDAYKDVLESQLVLLKHYGFINDYFKKIHINSESIQKLNNNYSEFTFHQSREPEWGGRLLEVLENIEEEYIWMFFDDYFPQSYFSRIYAEEMIEYVLTNNVDCLLLSPVLDLKDQDANTNRKFNIVPVSTLYRINSAPAIWKKSALIRTLRKNDSPWSWECFGAYRDKIEDFKIEIVKKKSKYEYKYSYLTGGAIYRGAWVSSVIRSYDTELQNQIDTKSRVIVEDLDVIKRSLAWKLNFMLVGYNTSGIKSFEFFYKSLALKLKKSLDKIIVF